MITPRSTPRVRARRCRLPQRHDPLRFEGCVLSPRNRRGHPRR
ncbi:hypothetical protein FTUN_8432 [Frigoriglobus tundricola]|uniref:Uncharacterized protein n=1 Tax=Frigoriglobus tundricola TaxID=2774151 RepID=A0A6M5Z5V3_9BACT|nr:hypothetical protein FTUN_8432 [Frigoriglobus tundricola]